MTTITKLPTQQELQEAKSRGQIAGDLLSGAALNPYEHKTHLSHIWNTERLNATARRLYSKVR